MRFTKPAPVKKPAIGVRKVTMSLPPSVVDELDHISKVMGLSRSGFLSSLLSEALPPLRATLDTLVELEASSEGDSEASQQRRNADSQEAIDAYLRGIVGGVQDDLFGKK